MPRKASPLSSSFIGNFTWIYIFIHHMICVLLGVSFSFVSICLLLFRIIFCIYIFNKNVKDSLYHAYFASIHVLFENRKFTAIAKIPRKVRMWSNAETFWKISSDKFSEVWYCFQNFGAREVWILLHSLQTVLVWQIAVMFALFAYVFLFNDSICG